MGLRITTWNVNGIRNPFGYQPWRDKRSFEVRSKLCLKQCTGHEAKRPQAMFDILEADIVVFQETKIQRKDLSDDMVLVPGWDCYFSLPRHKKGYSGVVIYTRQSVCAPIRAEEGITGLLCLPNSSTAFMECPEEQQIGGYPTPAQLAVSAVDATTLDSEGRCVILEFPAFVLIGVYCPANRDETRDDFRIGFLDVLDARIRNLIANGKNVFLTGDLNISRDEIDAANAEASMRKQGLSASEFVSTPARRLFNHLLEGGKIFGERDEGRESPVMRDICRAFHPDRRGMFTCWEQKVNARPGNCGARIDYVLCSLNMKQWFSDSNIQEGLMGSDHCPVYAKMKDRLIADDKEHDTLDLMNPPGMFLNGQRQREYSATVDLLPLSGRLIPEFFGRRSIRDMFFRKPSMPKAEESQVTETEVDMSVQAGQGTDPSTVGPLTQTESSQTFAADITSEPSPYPSSLSRKRSASQAFTSKTAKHAKSTPASLAPSANGKGQQSLKGFFKPKHTPATVTDVVPEQGLDSSSMKSGPAAFASPTNLTQSTITKEDSIPPSQQTNLSDTSPSKESTQIEPKCSSPKQVPQPNLPNGCAENEATVHDPIVSRESWSKLFTKPAAPRCESHSEPCITMLTKKQGMNLGRSFWMCPRPIGPSGMKEKNTQWRCGTFIWCSDWNSNTTSTS